MKKVNIAAIPAVIALLGFCFAALGTWIANGPPVECCDPPVDSSAARFPQNAQVTVYLNPTGLTDTEVQAITTGLQDWNNQNNHSGVSYAVVVTTDPLRSVAITQ